MTGTITLNGEPVRGVIVRFLPDAKQRPSVGTTGDDGAYTARITSRQVGVALGPCVVQFEFYRGESGRNLLPPEYHENAADDPDLRLDVTAAGLVFDYDISYDGELRPADQGPPLPSELPPFPSHGDELDRRGKPDPEGDHPRRDELPLPNGE